MAVNVVYNPETKTWVRSGSSDDTGNTIKPETFGKTAEEVRSERVRRARQIQEQPEIISKVVMDGKETTLRSSPSFAEKLKVALGEKNLKTDPRFSKTDKGYIDLINQQSISKQEALKRTLVYNNDFKDSYKVVGYSRDNVNADIPDYLRRKPETKNTIPKSFLPPKTPIRETKEVVDKSFIRPPPPALTQTFISESGKTPQFFETTPEEIKAQEKRTEGYIWESKNPIKAGVKEGAKTLAISAGVAIPATAIAVAIPAAAPAITVAGVGFTAKYGYDILKDFKRGDFGVKEQARTATELIGFGAVGKGISKFSSKLQTRKTNLRSQRNLAEITNTNINWKSQQMQTTQVKSVALDSKGKPTISLQVQRPKGIEVKIITPTKIRTEIQTQLAPKQVIPKPKIKTISQATPDTPIQTFIRQGKGQELVFQAKTKTGIKQIYRKPTGEFIKVQATNKGIIETKSSLSEIQQFKSLFGGAKRTPKDIRQFTLDQTRKIPPKKYDFKIKDFKPKVFEGGMFGSKKAQLSTQPLSRFSNQKGYFKDRIRFKPATKLTGKIKSSFKSLPKQKTFPIIITGLSFGAGQFTSIKPKLSQKPQITPRTATKPKITQIPRLRLSQKQRQAQTPTITPRTITEQPSRNIIIPTTPKPKTITPKLKFTTPKKTPQKNKINEKIPIKRQIAQEKPAYNVFVRERNKWRKIEGNVPKNKAYNIGASYTDKNPTKKFKLVQKGKTTQPDEAQTFINYKFTQSNNVYNEKKKYQKDRLGEVKKNEFF